MQADPGLTETTNLGPKALLEIKRKTDMHSKVN